MNALDLELALDRYEAELAPELAAHAAALHARALVDAHPAAPPWPALLLDGRVARLARAAASVGDAGLRARLRTLERWATAAALAGDAAWREARASARDLPGLARRHRTLAGAAARLGFASARALVDAMYGAVPPRSKDGVETAGEGAGAGAGTGAGTGAGARERVGDVPGWREVLARLVARHGLETAGLDVRAGAAALTTVITPGQVRCVIGPGRDGLDALVVAMHEIGHGLYAAQQGGLPLGLAAAPTRWFDEAVAAWAVRSLEHDPAIAGAARAHRVRREALTRDLVQVEAALLDGAPVEVAWGLAPGLRLPEVPALLDEPGVMASYQAADEAQLAPAPGQLRAWARAGAGR